jgi:hypothetical protein
MDLHTVSIGMHTFTLVPDIEIALFQEQLTELMRQGGGMIDIPTPGPEQVSALLPPGVPVMFCTQQVEGDDVAPEDDDWILTYPELADFDLL